MNSRFFNFFFLTFFSISSFCSNFKEFDDDAFLGHCDNVLVAAYKYLDAGDAAGYKKQWKEFYREFERKSRNYGSGLKRELEDVSVECVMRSQGVGGERLEGSLKDMVLERAEELGSQPSIIGSPLIGKLGEIMPMLSCVRKLEVIKKREVYLLECAAERRRGKYFRLACRKLGFGWLLSSGLLVDKNGDEAEV